MEKQMRASLACLRTPGFVLPVMLQHIISIEHIKNQRPDKIPYIRRSFYLPNIFS